MVHVRCQNNNWLHRCISCIRIMSDVLDWKAMSKPLVRIFYFTVVLVTCLVAYLSVTKITGINFKNLIKQ